MGEMKAIAVSMIAALASATYASPQPEALVQQIRAAYPETLLDANALKVVKPGTTLVVQMDGMQANPTKSGAFANTFENGQFVHTESKSEKLSRFGLSVPQRKAVDRPVAQGAKVYLLNTEFSPDAVGFTVQTCGDCDPAAVDPGYQTYRAKVTFKFVHGALAATDLKHVQQTIEQVFKYADAAGTAPAAAPPAASSAQAPPPPPAQAEQFAPVAPPPPPAQAQDQYATPPPAAAQEGQSQFAPIAPPPPPQDQYGQAVAPPAPPAPRAPRVLKLGMTPQQVKETFGEPAATIELGGGKLMYVYKDKKVTFANGKVADVELL